MAHLIPIGLFLPLCGFILLLLLAGKTGRTVTALIGCATPLLAFFCFASFLFLEPQHFPFQLELFSWIPIEGVQAHFSLYLDHIALLMTLIITGIGFLIHLYSIGYMEHEEDFARYFACLNFFVFAMLLLVLAKNLLLLFVGWEGVGLASYLLIGYWYQRPAAAQAATKAFIINRIGDFGFLVGILFLLTIFGTSDIPTILERAPQTFAVGAALVTLITLLLFMGASGKSAQLPLHTWLPDAMEGPTPVSALIHAATMVTAGVYLIVRLHPLFLLAPVTLHFIGWIGAITALFASLAAIGQKDLKRVLAYSTISQLGLMFLACGAGAFYAAMFHLTTHAFMKSLLFLSAGNVVHMMHGLTDMDKMGGLYKKFPLTHWLFLIGALAMSGIPPLAAFFSKDLILEQEYTAGFHVHFFIALVASILTGFYLMRAYFLTFRGTPRLDDKILKAAHEAPWIMNAPVMLLALFSMIGGFLGYQFAKFPILEKFLKEIHLSLAEQELVHHELSLTLESSMTILGAFVGVLIALVLYTQYRNLLKSPLTLFERAFYFNELYQILFVRPFIALTRFVSQRFEPRIIEGSIQATGQFTQKTARLLQKMQNGEIRSYVAWMVLGALFLILQFALRE